MTWDREQTGQDVTVPKNPARCVRCEKLNEESQSLIRTSGWVVRSRWDKGNSGTNEPFKSFTLVRLDHYARYEKYLYFALPGIFWPKTIDSRYGPGWLAASGEDAEENMPAPRVSQ
jgi:hypothetical protein